MDDFLTNNRNRNYETSGQRFNESRHLRTSSHAAPVSAHLQNEAKPNRGEKAQPAAKTISLHISAPRLSTVRRKVLGVFRSVRHSKLGVYVARLAPSRTKHPWLSRLAWGAMALLMFFTIFTDIFVMDRKEAGYTLSAQSQALMPAPQATLGKSLKFDVKQQVFKYNEGYSARDSDRGDAMSPKFSASFSQDPKKGFSVTDPVYQTSLGITPSHALEAPRQDGNRLIYPVTGRDVQEIYTAEAVKVKQDIILNSYQGDKQEFTYTLNLAEGTEARMEANGSIGVYGADPALLSNVSTGSEKDAKLLKAAREKAEKTQLLFTIPAPFIRESGVKQSKAHTWLALNDNKVTVYAEGLKDARYPLTIDPTVYIDTAARLMKGNNESNIDFDIDNELIQKGKTTGGRFDSWISTNSLQLPTNRWNHATTVAGGYMYIVGGNNGTSTLGDILWAKFDASTGNIVAANPGTGACASWCTSSNYALPSGVVRQGASLVAYNGYLYLMGGLDGSGVRTNSVYIAKLGANGEPQMWQPTKTDPMAYWFADTTLSSATAFAGAVAYNNRMYFLGGSTSGSTGGTNVVSRADIAPFGKLVNWTTSGMTTLPTNLRGHSVQVYNDRLYVIGGANGTATQNNVYYTKINTDGTLNAWISTTQIGNGAASGNRASLGGNFSTVWGGFIYVAGGCNAMNASGYCTTMANDTQLASINTDGSITDWTTVSGVTSTRSNYGFVAWRNRLYALGGCSAQNTTSGVCSTMLSTTQKGEINQDGDVSTVSTSTAPGAGACSGANPMDCDLPPQGDKAGQSGRMAGATIINNGYIYYMGGCTAVNSGSVCFTGNAGKASNNVAYASIDSVGNIVQAPGCAVAYTGSWCVNDNGLPAYLAAFSLTAFNNRIYLIGGTNGTRWQDRVYSSSFNNDGTWGAWTTQSFATLGLGNAKGYTFAFTRANPSAAATAPGNLYVLGGCSGITADDTGLDCTGALYTGVYKCNILTTGLLDTSTTCTTTGQLQIDSEPLTSGAQGLGVMAGTVYANYIYLIGGQSANESERGTVLYAKIDNNNNIVAINGSSTGDWTISPSTISPVRRRGMAFGYNGYLYALAGYNSSGGGSLQDLLYAKINVSDGSIAPFTTSTVTVTARWDLRGVVNNGYVYAIGGCSTGAPPASCTTMTGTVQTFQLYNNYSGSPKSYAAGSQFATDRYGSSSTVLNGYIYVAGGCVTTATDCTTATNSVQYAPLNADGTIGTWAAAANLPTALAWGQLETAGGSLYYVGGQTGGSNNGVQAIYWATPSAGSIASWSSATNELPAGRTQHGATVWNNRIYVVGGNGPTGVATSTVYVSPQLSAGGNIASAWSTTSTNFNVARSGATAIAYANNLYVLGGYTGSSYLNDVQFSQINTSTGAAGAWKYTTSLPSYLRQADGFAANGFMYIFGGRNTDTECRSNTIVAPISANTTIASGNTPTGIGEWYATNVKYGGARYGGAAVYNEGRTYVLGGQCGGTMVTTTNKVQYATLQAQPQIAKYSRMIDADSDVFPTVWLMNGLDNSTGARWYMKYRSMTDPQAPSGQECIKPIMSSWGQDTSFGEVTLGRVEQYVPKNAGGVSTNCARYYYMLVTIDSQQAYGYPEDVTRGPTIADLSLFYTADPSKRLIHGKTFTGGEQQPLDTSCRTTAGQPNCPAIPN